MTKPIPPSQVLTALAEPTRLRILNCLAAAPLCVSDLQAILHLPQPTVSRHLTVLRHVEAVLDTRAGPFVLYRLRIDRSPVGRLLKSVTESLRQEERLTLERHQALDRHRSHTRVQIPSGVLAGDAHGY